MLVRGPARSPSSAPAAAPALFPLRLLGTAWVDVFRGVPTILLVYLIGFGIPALQLSGPPTDPVGARRDRAQPLLQRLRGRGLPGRDPLGPPQPARRRAGGRADRRAQTMRHVILPAGDAAIAAAAAQRLRLPAKGRRPGLGDRPAGGLPDRPDLPGAELQLHAADVAAALLYLAVTIPTARLVERIGGQPGEAREPWPPRCWSCAA